MSLVVAGGLSGFAVWIAFLGVTIRTPNYQNTHVIAYFICLLLANALQAIGSIMNVKWVAERVVEAGTFCSVQGGIKQAGNVGMALWSFMIAMHIFNLLFLRWKSTELGKWLTIGIGWFSVAFIVSIGPLAIQKESIGPYFGPSGYWCWITHLYPQEQTYLEYFFEFLSAGISILLYTGILLRVRGNIIRVKEQWKLRWVAREESWQLAISRDVIDTSMLRVARRMVWYPVAYSIMLIPVSLARLISFGGHNVPFWATILADTIFNLQGFANVIIFFFLRRFVPDTASLPDFSTPRQEVDVRGSTVVHGGITPFILPPAPPPIPEEPEPKPEDLRHRKPDIEMGLNRSDSTASTSTVDSTTLLNRNGRKSRWNLPRPMSWMQRK